MLVNFKYWHVACPTAAVVLNATPLEQQDLPAKEAQVTSQALFSAPAEQDGGVWAPGSRACCAEEEILRTIDEKD